MCSSDCQPLWGTSYSQTRWKQFHIFGFPQWPKCPWSRCFLELTMFTKHHICFTRILVDLFNLREILLTIFLICAGQQLTIGPQDWVSTSRVKGGLNTSGWQGRGKGGEPQLAWSSKTKTVCEPPPRFFRLIQLQGTLVCFTFGIILLYQRLVQTG